MIVYPWGALFTGAMLILAGGFTLARHFLLQPISTHYPKAPKLIQNVIFLFAGALLFLGLQFVWVFWSGKPNTIPPQPSATMQFLATSLVFYSGAMLANIIRQRYPETVWIKLNRISDAMSCRDKSIWGRIFS
jgi:membrane peptidoglycan carboxypeptidase